jgi:hypothetical protein
MRILSPTSNATPKHTHTHTHTPAGHTCGLGSVDVPKLAKDNNKGRWNDALRLDEANRFSHGRLDRVRLDHMRLDVQRRQ